ncbi:MAG: hypothetical protein GQ557_00305 [Mycoplasmataceae bacterium]|nr:hypothetical protein [Mycoplasmataceae bacterium]
MTINDFLKQKMQGSKDPFAVRNKRFRILSVDGGGLKGMFTAYAILKLKEEYNIDLFEEFDMFVGTSTGSIIIGALLSGWTAQEIYNEYLNGQTLMFGKPYTFREQMTKLLYARYDDSLINESLKKTLGDKTIAEIEKLHNKPFIIAATNMNESKPIMFGSSHFKSLNKRYNSLPLWQMVRASAAAPFYLEPIKEETTGANLFDGGVWANNPALMAIVLAQGDLNIDLKNIEMLSFGQTFIEGISIEPSKGKDLLKNPSKNAIGLLAYSALYANQNFDTFAASLLLKNRLLRYSPREANIHGRVDKVNKDYIEYCRQSWETNKEYIVEFIKTGRNNNYHLGETKRYN